MTVVNFVSGVYSPPPAHPEKLWTGPLGVLTTALEVSKVSATRVASVEAELLLHMGKIQRQLFNMGFYEARVAANTLIDAISTSFTNDHNLRYVTQSKIHKPTDLHW